MAESADVGANLAGSPSARNVPCIGSVYAQLHEVIPVGGVRGVSVAQLTESAENVACLDLVDEVVV